MTELFYNLTHPLPNAVMTVIMAVLAVYWIFTLVLGVGLDDLDLGFELDVDAPDIDAPDVDVDVDGDVETVAPEHEVATEKTPGFFMKVLSFMNVGRVPFMLVFTVFKLFAWISTLITTSIINVVSWGLLSLLILIPIGFICVFLTKFATNPMARFFKQIGYRGEEVIDFLGRSGIMLSTIKDEKIGTAEVIVDKNPIKLSVKSMDGSEIKYGDYVTIIDESDSENLYLVDKEISLRNI